MFGMGMPEILVILAVALIVIGPKKLPDLAKSLGRALHEFRKATTDLKDSLIVDPDINEVKTPVKDPNSVASAPSSMVPDAEKANPSENSDIKTTISPTSPQESQEPHKDA